MKTVVRTTSTSEATGFKTPFADKLPGYREIELNVFDLVDSSIRRGPNSIVFGKLIQLERFRMIFFCIELE